MTCGIFQLGFFFVYFFLVQKPYGCQLPGCTKRYTDPSSLRKHVKNHAIKDQQNSKRKNTKEPEVAQKKMNLIEKERSCDQSSGSVQEFITKPEIYIKEESIFPMNSFEFESSENNQIEESTNSLDLMDISKCIMGIEEDKNLNNDFESMNYDHESSDQYKVEAIKKYLIEQPTEYIDLNLLQFVKQDYFNNF